MLIHEHFRIWVLQVTSQHLSPGSQVQGLASPRLAGWLVVLKVFEASRVVSWSVQVQRVQNILRDFQLTICKEDSRPFPFGLEWNRYESAARNFFLDLVIPWGMPNDYLKTGLNKFFQNILVSNKTQTHHCANRLAIFYVSGTYTASNYIHTFFQLALQFLFTDRWKQMSSWKWRSEILIPDLFQSLYP